MKFAKYLVSSAAAIAVAGTLSVAVAQTSTPGNYSTNSATTTGQQGSTKDAAGTMMPNRTMNTTTPGTTYNSTTSSMDANNSGTTADMDMKDNNRTQMSKRRAARTTTGTDTNTDGSMSGERLARADRG